MDQKPDALKELAAALTQASDTKKVMQDFVGIFKDFVVPFLTKMKEASASERQQFAQEARDTIAKLEEQFQAIQTSLNQSIEQQSKSITEKLAALDTGAADTSTSLSSQVSDAIAAIPDTNALARAAAELIKLPEYRAPIMDGPQEIRDKLELLQGDERLDATAIKGLEEMQSQVKALATRPFGTMTPSGPILYVGGTRKGRAQELKLKAGSNMTLSHNTTTGEVTFTSTGGSGFTTLAATETPNGNTKVFTFSTASAQPSYIVVDNVWLKATTASGVVNWTWNGGTKKATLTTPANEDIWGVV